MIIGIDQEGRVKEISGNCARKTGVDDPVKHENERIEELEKTGEGHWRKRILCKSVRGNHR